jgi:hypothetical protein
MNSFKKQPLIKANLSTLILSQQNENAPVYEINLTRFDKQYYKLRYNCFNALYNSQTNDYLDYIDVVKVKSRQPSLSANQKAALYRMNICLEYKLKEEKRQKCSSSRVENSKRIEEKVANPSNDEQEIPKILHEMYHDKHHRRGDSHETVIQYFSLSGDAERAKESRLDSNMLLKPPTTRSLKGSPVPSRTQSASIQ